ncbi:MAG: hypothetical protein D5R98_08330 [Desulfonatronovibrio sp. MSAO_Bac4]|nr:MAG: hypothetical protein D5R98_08330 [Desulfonatronovibrio sp. MSAO_Bac4]
MKNGILLFASFFVVFLLMSCAPKKPAPEMPEKAVVAVAHFSQPVHRWQMINNHIVVGKREISQEIVQNLDSDLAGALSGSRHVIVPAKLVEQCQTVTSHGTTPGSAFHYWVQVGKCVPADYILVPFVFDWRDRDGGEWGVNEPAKVTLELNLIDVKELSLNRFLFDERQQSLTENLLSAGRFFQRGGKWVSARELSREGLEQGIRELGL